MDLADLLGATWSQIAAAVLATCAIYVLVIAATRVLGLRSFAKMSAFDFASTVAVGSLIAAVGLGQAPLAVGVVAVAVVYLLQAAVAIARRGRAARIIDNRPVLLMDGPSFLEDNLRRTRVTREDVYAKLRAAGVTRLEQVQAAVLETTGDVSVLHGDPAGPPLDDRLLQGVAREAGARLGRG